VEVAFYVLILLVLLILPLLAQWRWGVLASLMVTAAELGLLLLTFRSLPPPPPRGPIPKKDVLEHLMKTHAEGFAYDLAVLVLAIVPAIAVLIGAMASVVWAAVRATRRSAANRQSQSQPQ
jgi:hypothetical protein